MDAYFTCAHFPETSARCLGSRALPLPAVGCLISPTSLSTGFAHYLRVCRFAECAEGSTDCLKCSILYAYSTGTHRGESHRCMFRFVFACSPATIRLPWNTDHPLLLVVITSMPRLPAATVCTHRAHRFRYNERSTQDVNAGRELADSLKYIGNMGSKYEDMGKTPRCVIMSSRGCVHVAKTSWLQRRAARFHNNLMLHKLYCAAGRFCGTWYGMYVVFVV